MKKAKKTVTRAVVYTHDEWERVAKLAEEYKMLPAVFIRHNALNCKFMECGTDPFDKLDSAVADKKKYFFDYNKTAKNVNTDGKVYAKDVEDTEKIISVIEDIVNGLPPLVYKEVDADCLLSNIFR